MYVTPTQLEILNKSEGVGTAYRLATFPEIQLELDGCDTVLEEIPIYTAVSGVLLVEKSPVALEAIPATNRQLTEWSQREVLEYVAGLVGEKVPAFIHHIISSPTFRHSVNDLLCFHALRYSD
jgi:hypothetical protein